jgi:hypothetical protein
MFISFAEALWTDNVAPPKEPIQIFNPATLSIAAEQLVNARLLLSLWVSALDLF